MPLQPNRDHQVVDWAVVGGAEDSGHKGRVIRPVEVEKHDVART
jgi:hypothetical protein